MSELKTLKDFQVLIELDTDNPEFIKKFRDALDKEEILIFPSIVKFYKRNRKTGEIIRI